MSGENYKNVNMRKSLNLVFLILQIAGMWPPEDEENQPKQKLFKIYATFIIFTIFAVYVSSEVMNMIVSLGDLEKMTNASFLLMTHLVQIIKYVYLHKYTSKVKYLANSLNRDIFRPRNEKQYIMVKNLMDEYQWCYQIFLITAFFTVLLWGVFPFVDVDAEERALPMSAWYPFETKSSPRFEIVFAYQMVAVIANAFFNISLDAMGPGFMVHICIQLDLLNDSIENIYGHSVENALNAASLPTEENDIHKHLRKSLIRIINHHQTIFEFKNDVNEVFANIIFWQFVISVIIICITMFQLTLVSFLSIQFISMILYQACMLFEILFYCWYGNEMILKSSKLTLSAWNSEWLKSSQEYKKDLIFFMLRTHRTIKMYGGNFFTLSLETFIAILRSSWSYFAVLYNVHNRP